MRISGLLDREDIDHEYKSDLADLVRSHISSGDDVVEIGGGRGVMTTLAAREGAHVRTYEPVNEMVELIDETTRASCVSDRVDIERAVVGEPRRTIHYGSISGARRLDPSELEPADAMILDCEGAEAEILENMAIEPDRVIVEPHPAYGVSLDDVRSILEDRGFELVEARKKAAIFRSRS